MSSEAKCTKDDELQRDGWEKRFSASEPRLSEARELYRSLGYEVLVLDAVPLDLNEEECSACLNQTEVKTLYTRKQ